MTSRMVGKKKRRENRGETSDGFWLSTPEGLLVLGIGGSLILIWGFGIREAHPFIGEIVVFVGETCLGAALLSVILERHTMKDYYRKVRDDLMLNAPSFVERYTEKEVDGLIEVAFRRKLRLNLGGKENPEVFRRLVDGNHFLIRPYIEQTVLELGRNRFYCENHRRQINIEPISNTEYRIEITVEAELKNLTDEEIRDEQHYRFCYISQEQIDSFELCALNIDEQEVDISVCHLNRKKEERPGTDQHPFNYWVMFQVPLTIPPASKMHYTLKYQYKNYEQSCYITYAMPYITKSYQDIYSLVGKNAHEYQIHSLAYTPYEKTLDSRSMVQRLNALTLSVRWDHWTPPGCGMATVVRKIVQNEANTLHESAGKVY